jgi:hypothetical protein
MKLYFFFSTFLNPLKVWKWLTFLYCTRFPACENLTVECHMMITYLIFHLCRLLYVYTISWYRCDGATVGSRFETRWVMQQCTVTRRPSHVNRAAASPAQLSFFRYGPFENQRVYTALVIVWWLFIISFKQGERQWLTLRLNLRVVLKSCDSILETRSRWIAAWDVSSTWCSSSTSCSRWVPVPFTCGKAFFFSVEVMKLIRAWTVDLKMVEYPCSPILRRY